MVKREARILVYSCLGRCCCALALRGAAAVEAVYLALGGPEELRALILGSRVYHELEYEWGGGLGLPLKPLDEHMVPRRDRERLEEYRGFAEALARRLCMLAEEEP